MSAAFRRRKVRGGDPVGMLVLEWERADLGRYYRAILTDTQVNRRRLGKIRAMFDTLYEIPEGRELIRAMIGRKMRGRRRSKMELAAVLHPLDVYRAFRAGKQRDLPTADQLAPLTPALEAFRDTTRGDDLRKIRAQVVRLLETRKEHRLADLAELVEAAMERKADTPVLANRIREQALSFAHDVLGEDSSLLKPLRAIEEIEIHASQRAPKVHLTPKEFWALAEDLGRAWPVFRDMAMTGMIQKEFYGEWDQDETGLGIWVPGTKTDYRPRWVPLIQPIERPLVSQNTLMAACRKIRKVVPGFRPYTARHTFSRWLEEAGGIPAWRQSVYMGHSTREMARRGIAVAQTLDYQTGDVRRYLPGDRLALRQLLGLPPIGAQLEAIG